MITIIEGEKSMSETLPAVSNVSALPAMVDRASRMLASAMTAAEILEARDMAGVAYDAAKRAGRFAQAKGAHDELLSKLHRAQADALDIEARAKRRLADEYDAAQERGEVAKIGDNLPSVPNGNAKATSADLGISRKDIHEARVIRDAEEAEPGIVKKTIDAAVAAGEEPTRAKVRRATLKAARPDNANAATPRPTRGKAAVIARVREAIAALSGLPPAEEVAAYLRGTDDAVMISEQLPKAAGWLAAFADLWTEEGAHAEAA